MSICVRFAPSPTGFLHVGNIRAALLNWLLAKKYNGTFILRMDDTDLERSEQRFVDGILSDLSWLGLTHDKFFRQSERFDRYKEVMAQLIEDGRLYPCYETPEELAFKRKRQLSQGKPPVYDRAALSLTEEDKKEFEKSGRVPHWRFRLLDEPIHWDDLIRGPITFQGDALSDPVLIRADGVPLYTFCSVIDDIDTAITHVIRGEDHVSNTAVQVQLIEAITKKKNDITFAHFSLLNAGEDQKLSKRFGSLSVGSLKEQGIVPMAINSLLARVGTSLPIEPFADLMNLVEHLDFKTFSKNPCRFDAHELDVLNEKILHMTSFETFKTLTTEKTFSHIDEKVWDIIKQNIKTLNDVSVWDSILGGKNPLPDILEEDRQYLKEALSKLPTTPWDESTWAAWTNELKTVTGRKGKSLFHPLRVALTGLDHGPEMKVLLPLLGRERVIQSLEKL